MVEQQREQIGKLSPLFFLFIKHIKIPGIINSLTFIYSFQYYVNFHFIKSYYVINHLGGLIMLMILAIIIVLSIGIIAFVVPNLWIIVLALLLVLIFF